MLDQGPFQDLSMRFSEVPTVVPGEMLSYAVKACRWRIIGFKLFAASNHVGQADICPRDHESCVELIGTSWRVKYDNLPRCSTLPTIMVYC